MNTLLSVISWLRIFTVNIHLLLSTKIFSIMLLEKLCQYISVFVPVDRKVQQGFCSFQIWHFYSSDGNHHGHADQSPVILSGLKYFSSWKQKKIFCTEFPRWITAKFTKVSLLVRWIKKEWRIKSLLKTNFLNFWYQILTAE